jgi:hypothetical protein
MKNLILCNFLFVGISLMVTQGLKAQDGERLAALAANDTYPTFSLTLASKSAEYRIGSKMWITIVQTNLTNHDIDCSYTDHFEAIDEDGKQIKEYSWVPELYAHGCTLDAGQTDKNMQQIERVFKFERPGKYSIRVSRKEPFLKDEKGESPVVWSNPITIQITG